MRREFLSDTDIPITGSVFRATHLHSGQVVACKLQDVASSCPTNRYERRFYRALQGGEGMPTLWAEGVEGRHDYLAIDLLGRSLDSLYRERNKAVWDLRSVCCVAMQVVSMPFACCVSQLTS